MLTAYACADALATCWDLSMRPMSSHLRFLRSGNRQLNIQAGKNPRGGRSQVSLIPQCARQSAGQPMELRHNVVAGKIPTNIRQKRERGHAVRDFVGNCWTLSTGRPDCCSPCKFRPVATVVPRIEPVCMPASGRKMGSGAAALRVGIAARRNPSSCQQASRHGTAAAGRTAARAASRTRRPQNRPMVEAGTSSCRAQRGVGRDAS